MIKPTAVVLALSLSLGGCVSVFDGGLSPTASINNPVTPIMLYNAENAMTVAVAGALAYKRLCVQRTIAQSCRGVVVKLQGYTRQARPVLKSLRVFVRNNQQINAITAYNLLRQLLLDFKAVAANNGVAS